MAGLLSTISNLFTYKEQDNEELGFELLEDQDESKGWTHNLSSEANTNADNASKNTQQNNDTFDEITDENIVQEASLNQISSQLNVNITAIRQRFLMSKNQDIIIREFNIARKVNAFLVYIDGMIDKQILNLSILPYLMSKDAYEETSSLCLTDYLMKNILTVHNLRKSNKYSEAIMQVLNGLSALFIDGCNECIIIETKGYEKRNIEKPVTETVIKGSQEGFTESLRTNMSMIRRIIKNEKLVTEILPLGNTNNSSCAVIYLDGITNAKVIQEVKKRIERIDTDFVMGDGMVEQFIEDNSLMMFPQILNTERPDRTASYIMEGHVAIISDGTPFALIVPITFFSLFHSAEDSFVRWPSSIFLRMIRLIGLLCAGILPGIYVAITLFHPEAIPTLLLESILQSRENVPFPILLEVLLMEIAFEIVREGSIRVPSVIGQTLGIVGALILGQAVVTAGLVSPIVVIIVSVTGIGSFAIPNYSFAISVRIMKFLFIFAAAIFGFYGLALMLFIMAVLACSAKSFGVPIFSPVAPKTKVNMDLLAKAPIWMQRNRPDVLNTPNRKRQGNNKKVWVKKDDRNNQGEGDNS